MIGMTLGGNYQILEQAGTEGPFELYLARDLRSEAVVAVRVIPTSSFDTVMALRFLDRTKKLKQLRDDRIAGVLDAGMDSGTSYVVVERPEGASLDQLVPERHRMAVADAAGLIYQALHALGIAHDAGIVHRNLTPQRLVVGTDGVLKVTGFENIPATWLKAAPAESPAGTSAYASPEETSGRNVDGRSDLFSLGVILYELLTGRLPSADEGETADRQDYVPPPLRLLRPDVPKELEVLLGRVLDPDPNRRPNSAEEMRRALEAAMQGKPYELATAVAPTAPVSLPAPNPAPWQRSSRRVLVLAAVAIVVLAMATGTALTVTGLVPLTFTQPVPAAPTSAPAVAAAAETAVPTTMPTAVPTTVPTAAPTTRQPQPTPLVTLTPGVLLVKEYPEKDSLGVTWQVKQWSDGTYTKEEVVPPPKLASIGAKVAQLRLFESGPVGLPLEKRVYSTRFAKATTRYMNYELDLNYPAPREPVDFVLRAFYYDAAGKELVEQAQSARIEAGWTQSYHWNGYGWTTPGNWSTGTYRLDIYDGSTKIASTTFEIY